MGIWGQLAGALLVIFLFGACGDKKAADAESAPVTARMETGADLAVDFFAQPYPLETRKVNGRVDLRGFPNPINNVLVDAFKEMIGADLDGAGTNSAIYFSFTGDIRFEQAVTDAEASMRGEAAILLLNVDAASPDYGKFTPVFSRFYRGESRFLPVHTLAVAPVPGFPLRERTLYAAMVLNGYGLTGRNNPLAQSPSLREALAGKGEWADTFEALRKALPHAGIAPGAVIAATVFKTRDVTGPLFKARDWLHEFAPDDQVEITSKNQCWIESSVCTTRLILGTFASPRFQHGTAPYSGFGDGGFVLGEHGTPIVAGTDELRFAMSLPPGSAPPATGWPLVIYAHGTGGSRLSGPASEGRKLSPEGIALVSYDQPLQGMRHPHFQVEPGCTGDCPSLYTFNLLNPIGARDGFRQSALDAVQLMRSMLGLRFRLTENGPEHFFDPERIYYMGHSQGSTSGPLFVAAEKETIKAAVFSGPAGGLHLSFLYKDEPVDIPAFGRFLFDAHEDYDLFHPLLNLFQAFVESADPLNYGRYVGLEARGGAVRDVLLTVGLLDRLTPPLQADAFAATIGAQLVKPVYQPVPALEWLGLPALDAPFQGNQRAADGQRAWTAAYVQYPDDGHYAIYRNPAAQRAYVEFLATKAYGDNGIAWVEDWGER
jgi:hypothetical protein